MEPLLHGWTIQSYLEILGLIGAAVGIAFTIFSYAKGFVWYGYKFSYTKLYRKDSPTKFWLLFWAQIFATVVLLALGLFCAVTDSQTFAENFHR